MATTLDPNKYTSTGAVKDPYGAANMANAIPTKRYNSGGGVVDPYGTASVASANAPVTSAAMTPTTPINLPTTVQPTAAAGMSGAIEASNKSIAQQRAEAMTAQQENEVASRGNLNNQLLQEMMGVNTEMSQAASTIDRTAEDEARQRSDDLVSQMESNSLAARRQVESLQKNNPQGLFGGALQDEVNRIERDNEIRNADLAIEQLASLRRYERLNSIADRQLQLKLEPLKLKADNLKLFYEDNKDRFNKADDRLFSEVTRKAEQEYKKAEAVETALKDTKVSLLKSAAEQGAPASVQSAIQNSTTPEEAIKAAGIYGGDVMKRELLAQQIKTEKAQQSKYYADANAVKESTKKPLSGEASKLLSISSGLETDVNSIKAKIATQGYEKFLRGYITGTDRDTVKLLSRAADRIGRLRSGGAINKDEEARFISQFASKGDYAFGKDTDATSALDSILTEAQTVRSGIDPNNAYAQQIQTPQQPQNEFSAALGTQPKIQGAAIISGFNPDGSFNFKLPNK